MTEGMDRTKEYQSIIKSIEIMTLAPDDALVVKCAKRIKPEDARWIKSIMEASFPGHQVFVLDGDLELKVVRREDAVELK